jgi:hypothetical protein
VDRFELLLMVAFESSFRWGKPIGEEIPLGRILSSPHTPNEIPIGWDRIAILGWDNRATISLWLRPESHDSVILIFG